jgi:hypothetical protein
MYKDILRSIGGIDVFPVFSLIVFVAVFAAAIVRTLRIDRRQLSHLASLPLDGDEPDPIAAKDHIGAEEERW